MLMKASSAGNSCLTVVVGKFQSTNVDISLMHCTFIDVLGALVLLLDLVYTMVSALWAGTSLCQPFASARQKYNLGHFSSLEYAHCAMDGLDVIGT